jgi:sulfonate transport system substrate-binding protein
MRTSNILPKFSTRCRLLIGLLIFGAFLTGCKSAPKALQEVRFGTFSVAVDYGAYIVAQNKGWFDDVLTPKGLKAHYETFQSLPPINESLATNRIDVILEAEPPAIAGKAAGIDLSIVGVSCRLPVEIVVPMDSVVHELKDLKGKKIAVLAGTSSHYGLLKTLEKANLHPRDFQVIDMTPPDAKNAFETGKVDAWSVWSPWVEEEEVPKKGRDVPGGDAVVYSIIAARGGFAREHPDVLRDILGVMQRSKEWVRTNAPEAENIVAKQLNLPLDIIQAAWPKNDWTTQLSEAMMVDIQAKADFLKENGFIRTPVNVRNGFIDTSFAK